MPARFGYPRARRLRKRREYLAVQGQGRRVGGQHFQFFVLRRPEPAAGGLAPEARFGITVTRKVGNAVARNRIKRVVREGCRHASDSFPRGIDVVVLARASAVQAGAADVAAELAQLARRWRSAGASR